MSSVWVAVMTGIVYAGFLFGAAVIVGELIAYTQGLVGVGLLFTVGLLTIAAAPTVANWTLSLLLNVSKKN